MFDIGSSELLLIIIVAVVVIGPKDLPRVLYKLGQILGKGRAMTRHFRSGIDEMIRQAEMEEMEKKWAADNARIMAQTPPVDTTVPLGDGSVESSVLPAPAATTGFDPLEADVGIDDVRPDSNSVKSREEEAQPVVATPSSKTEAGSAT